MCVCVRVVCVCGVCGCVWICVLAPRTYMLSWGFATEGVCVRGGHHVAKADNE